MNAKSKNNSKSMNALRFGVGFVVAALIIGIYFLFKPFPAGPSLNAQANVPAAVQAVGRVNNWNTLGNHPEPMAGAELFGSSASVQRLDIGGGYVLENSGQGSRILAPERFAASASVQRLDIGGGYMLESSGQGSRILAPERFAAPAPVQRLDIGGGYVLENSAQGSRIVAPSSPQLGEKISETTVYLNKIDTGGGSMLVLTKDGWMLVPSR